MGSVSTSGLLFRAERASAAKQRCHVSGLGENYGTVEQSSGSFHQGLRDLTAEHAPESLTELCLNQV
jgi:hypothetical protein